MARFKLLIRKTGEGHVRVQEGIASTLIEFLESVDDHILEDYEWRVLKVDEGWHKDSLVADGTIDEVTS